MHYSFLLKQQNFKTMATKRRSNKGYLYVIRGGENIYKIGITKNEPHSRLRELQTGNDRKLELVKAYYRQDYKQLERKLHRQFNYCRLNGEWFNIDLQTIMNAVEGNVKYLAYIWALLQVLFAVFMCVLIVDLLYNNGHMLTSLINLCY